MIANSLKDLYLHQKFRPIWKINFISEIFIFIKIIMKPKNIVVTGGNSGVGYETVKGLYEEGHNVIFGSRSVNKNQEAVAEITKKAGGSLTSFPLDLSVRKSVEEFAKNVMAKFDHIDILVNNAGLIING